MICSHWNNTDRNLIKTKWYFLCLYITILDRNEIDACISNKQNASVYWISLIFLCARARAHFTARCRAARCDCSYLCCVFSFLFFCSAFSLRLFQLVFVYLFVALVELERRCARLCTHIEYVRCGTDAVTKWWVGEHGNCLPNPIYRIYSAK